MGEKFVPNLKSQEREKSIESRVVVDTVRIDVKIKTEENFVFNKKTSVFNNINTDSENNIVLTI